MRTTRNDHATHSTRLLTLVVVIAAVAVLYFARGILLPFALAALLSFVLSPLVRALERRRVPRVAAVVLVVLFAGGLIGGVGYVMAEQLVQLTAELPAYKQNVRDKVETLRGYTDGALDRMTRTVRELKQELDAGAAATRDSTADAKSLNQPEPPARAENTADPPVEADNADEPVPVQVVDDSFNVFGLMRDWLSSLLGSLGLAGIVIVLVIFILLEREDLRNRLIALIGQAQLHVTTRAIDEATERVSRYLRMQLLINVTYGAAVGLGLWAIGIPNAVLWGCLGAMLRFVPYIGPWLAALLPLTLAVAVGEGWTPVLLAAALFIGLELVTNNVLEPWLYGSSTGISALGIIASAFFWTWLWGPIGLILATPLTVCLTVVSRYVPQFRFLSILFGDEPALTVQARVYQRLLAVDTTEAQQVIDEFLAEHDPGELYDAALVPALAQAERDYCDGFLDESRRSFMLDFLREVIDDQVVESSRGDEIPTASDHEEPLEEPEAGKHVRVLIVPGQTTGDAIAVEAFQQRLAGVRTIDVVTTSPDTLAGEVLTHIEEARVSLVLIAAVSPISELRARYLTKRIRRQFPQVKVIVGLWSVQSDRERASALLASAGADHVAGDITEALAMIERVKGVSRLASPSAALEVA